jgi:hypothetical protein
MRHATAFLIMLASLTACASMEELHARDEATCARNGFQADSPDFKACVDEQQMLRNYFLTHPGRF